MPLYSACDALCESEFSLRNRISNILEQLLKAINFKINKIAVNIANEVSQFSEPLESTPLVHEC